MAQMTIQDRGELILENVNNSLKTARSRKKKIETAVKMLVNAGISDEWLVLLNNELDAARDEVSNLTIHRMLIRGGMIQLGWIEE